MAKTDTKERLLDTAIDLIWRNNYSAVSVDDICREADVRKGSFYYHYKSKADLAVAAMEKYYQDSKPVFNEVFSAEYAPLERFEKLADLVVEKQQDTVNKYGHVCGCPFATLGSEMAGQEELIREKADEVFRRYERFYESALRDMVAEGLLSEKTDVVAKAAEIYSYILGQVMMARIQNSVEPLSRDLKNGLFGILGVQNTQMENLKTA